MGPSRLSNAKKQLAKGDNKKDKKSASSPPPRRKPQGQLQQGHGQAGPDENRIELSNTIPLTLQQLALNVFRFALLGDHHAGGDLTNGSDTVQPPRGDLRHMTEDSGASLETVPAAVEKSQLEIKNLIQTIKFHLYNRDFDSAFTDASEELLRAYALRWSATRALGYAGVFKSLIGVLLKEKYSFLGSGDRLTASKTDHVVCIGGGAGAEIVALAAAWRDLTDENDRLVRHSGGEERLSKALDAVSLSGDSAKQSPGLSITAVDIADWSSVVDRLAFAIQSPQVPCSKSHPSPLYQTQGSSNNENQHSTIGFGVSFERLDVLSASEDTLRRLFRPKEGPEASTIMVTLMFTLNELFSTSMARATAFLLRTTDLLQPGTMLLVIDSPGSYSTLKLGKSAKPEEGPGPATMQERHYPMKFLLDHTLLSVAKGKWERVFSQDSRWWRRDAARLRYDVGEGASLEDMRFQVHIYRRLG